VEIHGCLPIDVLTKRSKKVESRRYMPRNREVVIGGVSTYPLNELVPVTKFSFVEIHPSVLSRLH